MVFDVGAQLERTTLAWIRTALALTAAGGLTTRCATRTAAPPLGYSVAAVLLATGVAAGTWSMRSYERRQAELHDGSPRRVGRAPAVCGTGAHARVRRSPRTGRDLGAASFPSW